MALVGPPSSTTVLVTYGAIDPMSGLQVQPVVAVSFDNSSPTSGPTGVSEVHRVDHTATGDTVIFGTLTPMDRISTKTGAATTWSWATVAGGIFVGDYMRGSFIFGAFPNGSGAPSPSEPMFLLPWVESQGGTTDNSQIHVNVMSLQNVP
jgi:hypothetical protein